MAARIESSQGGSLLGDRAVLLKFVLSDHATSEGWFLVQASRSRASSDDSLQFSRVITPTYPTTATAAITAQKAPPLRFPASR